ncbi:MAG: HNH endonuclease [Betaproteobacteria bacterium SG8_41]|nr:MAG: HNH endonuclease [Betaproteobacteria bacterium SG8_41]
MAAGRSGPDNAKLDRIVAEARRNREAREKGYREQALKLYPWVCGRCAREFTRVNLQLLEVHHRDGNHDNNPSDGSNWELLCTYCHEAEHRKYLDGDGREAANGQQAHGTQRPFEGLADLLKQKRNRTEDS